jgi:hypothetical protein
MLEETASTVDAWPKSNKSCGRCLGPYLDECMAMIFEVEDYMQMDKVRDRARLFMYLMHLHRDLHSTHGRLILLELQANCAIHASHAFLARLKFRAGASRMPRNQLQEAPG